MPWGDRTGPFGMGPRTGRGLGFCGGFDSPGFTKGPGWGRGRGFRRGFGWGRGWRWFWAMGGFPEDVMDVQSEKEWLRAEAESLKRRLADIEKRLNELESK